VKDTIIKSSGNSRSLASVPNFLSLYPTYEAFAQALVTGQLPIDIGPLNPAGCDVVGTSLNKANLLSDATAANLGLTQSDPTVNNALQALDSAVRSTVPISRGGTGRTSAAAALYALINGASALTGSTVATNDYLPLLDASAATGKKVTLSDLLTFFQGSGVPKMAAGSYTGTGKSGPSNPTSLTFPLTPCFVLIRANAESKYSDAGEYGQFIWCQGLASWFPNRTSTNADNNFLSASLAGHKLSFWAPESGTFYSNVQCNGAGATYRYFAIGTT